MDYRYFYYVEGQCEKKLIDLLKEHQLVLPGRSEVFNATQDLFNSARLRLLPPRSVVILIFDTDTCELNALIKNIRTLRAQQNVLHVWCVTSVENLEDKLIRSTDVKDLKKLLNCKRISDFKQSFISEKHLYEKLSDHQFDLSKLWITEPPMAYLKESITNQGFRIKHK